MSSVSHREKLRKRCEYYAAKYSYPQEALERGLEGYAAHLFVQEQGFDEILEGTPTSEVDLDDYICRRADLGIDVVLEDEQNKRILLIQAAWRTKADIEDKLVAFFDAPSRIASQDYVEKGDEKTQQLLASFAQKLADGYEVRLCFVTNLAVGDKQRLHDIVEAKNRSYEDADKPIICELYGAAELARREDELINAKKGGFVDEVTLNINPDQYIELSSPYRTIIAAIKANELVDLYRRRNVGNRIFNLNIRLPLTSQKVNPAMVATATDPQEGSNFFYYNNGVSAVCAGYELNGGKLKVHRLQVVNGAQTVSALTKAKRKNQDLNALVLFRLTETAEDYGGSFTDNVIKYNNTQNPVKVSDFFSNDDIQLWLRDTLPQVAGKGAIPAFYYIHKSGYKRSGKGIRIDQLAGIRHAFLYGPVPSYREPQQFFDRNLRYWEAFGENGEPNTTSWSDETLSKTLAAIAIHQRIQDIGRKLRSNEKTKATIEAKYLYRLARYVTALVGVGLETVRNDSFQDYATLIASTLTFNRYVDPILKEARSVLRREWMAMLENRERSGVQPEYNLARDDKLWARLSESLRQSVLTDIAEDL